MTREELTSYREWATANKHNSMLGLGGKHVFKLITHIDALQKQADAGRELREHLYPTNDSHVCFNVEADYVQTYDAAVKESVT